MHAFAVMSSEPEQHKQMTLEDVNVHCLVKIYSYLPLPDLLNVADSSNQLKRVADLAFSLQHGKKVLRFSCLTSREDRYWFTMGNLLTTRNLKIMYQLIRCFGHLLSRIEMDLQRSSILGYGYRWLRMNSDNLEHLISYVNNYCVASLTELTLLVDSEVGSMLHHFVKPFPNIQNVCVQSFAPQNVSLIEVFPTMRRLILHCKKMEELLSFKGDLQSLDHLEIISKDPWKMWEFWDPSLKQSIVQLRSLSLSYYTVCKPSIFSFDLFSNLQELKLNEMSHTILDFHATFHLKTVKYFTINYPETVIASFPVIPFSFDKLEKLNLRFNASNTFYLTSSPTLFYDYISRHLTILKLKIFNVPGLINLHRLMSILPLLEDVDLLGVFPIDDIFQFMNNMKALKRLKIRIETFTETAIADIEDRLKHCNGWSGERICCTRYTFTRKTFNKRAT